MNQSGKPLHTCIQFFNHSTVSSFLAGKNVCGTFRTTKGISHITCYRKTGLFQCRMDRRKINSDNLIQDLTSLPQNFSILIVKTET